MDGNVVDFGRWRSEHATLAEITAECRRLIRDTEHLARSIRRAHLTPLGRRVDPAPANIVPFPLERRQRPAEGDTDWSRSGTGQNVATPRA